MAVAFMAEQSDVRYMDFVDTRWRSIQSTFQQKVENRIGARGESVFSIAQNATVDALLGLCAERFKQPVNGTIGLYTADGRLLKGSTTLRSAVGSDETLYLQQRQHGDECLFGCSWFRWSVFCFVVAVAGIITVACVYALALDRHPFEMGVVIDAGSSHSEALIFKWDEPKTNGTGRAIQVGKVSGKQKKGISSLTPEQTYVDYQYILNQTKQVIANESKSTAFLYMSATGGMRLLRMQYPDRAAAIMGSAREAMKESGLQFKMAEISDGADEGAQGWVSINHIKNRLATYEPTLGAMDLGGASTQITVQVAKKTNFTTNLKLYGKEYFLFSKSYLCFGLDQAYLRYLMTLLLDNKAFVDGTKNDTKGAFDVVSPCHCDGYTKTKNLSEILSPCVWNNQLPKHVEDFGDQVVTVTGKWKPDECRAVTNRVFDVNECKGLKYGYCFDDIPIDLPMDSEYVAFSGFFFTTNEIGVRPEYKLAALDFAAKTFCNMTNKAWLDKYYGGDDSHAEAGCYKINVVRTIIADKYKFSDAGYQKMQITKEIDSQGISWPMGLMLDATNALPEDMKGSKLPTAAFIPLATFFVLLLFVSFVCFHYHRKADLRKVQGLMFASSIRTF